MQEPEWPCEFVCYVDDFLTAEECAEYVAFAVDVGFEEATVTGPQGVVRAEGVRNNDRVTFEAPELAERLWERAAEVVPETWDDRPAVGLNEFFRVYRYRPGQRFDWHQDFSFERDDGERSEWTLLVYLTEDFEGGETSFEDSYSDESFEPFAVTPRRGRAVLFHHPVHHCGELIATGEKYVLRTDVMYAAAEEEADDDEW